MKRERTLRPVHPNAGLSVEYRRRLGNLIAEMNASVEYWLRAAYRADPPELAQDAPDDTGAFFREARKRMPADKLREAMRKLAERWQRNFDEAAPKLAEWFAASAQTRSDAVLKKILKDGGFSVKFKMTPAARDVFNATVNQNVALIKSIPQQYLVDVEGMVQRSVQTGRDLGQLTQDLQKTYGVTRRRAALIARTQNNMATSSMNRARQMELGITHARWVHSAGGKEPRPTHVKAGHDQVTYEIAKGWYDPAVKEFIHPGQLINCRCVSRAVLPGLT